MNNKMNQFQLKLILILIELKAN